LSPPAVRDRVRIDPDRLADLLEEIHDEPDESAPDEPPLWRKRFDQ